MIVAFQGEPGAYGEEALRRLFGDVQTLPCPSFAQVFEAVTTGRAEQGVLPVENSHAGSITDNYDLLLGHDLFITGEVQLRVRHCLLAVKGQTLDEVRKVYSHAQALMQCEIFIQQKKLEAIAESNTAAAAKRVAAARVPGTAAIASRGAARLYDLEILAEGIETNPNNFTRFVSVSVTPSPRAEKTRTSVVFMTANVPGSLHQALGAFASRRLNMTKLESRPSRKVPWEYVFYLDFDGHAEEVQARAALSELQGYTSFRRVLGSYPRKDEAV
ncbi:MAG TPA: prephenate dehydratase [Myxococcaceae bacterium]|nr:prephenate dehydratase [Myxococcaceae bacterium]